jgi:hypothetical protein
MAGPINRTTSMRRTPLVCTGERSSNAKAGLCSERFSIWSTISISGLRPKGGVSNRLNALVKSCRQRSASRVQAGSMKSSHSLRRYLHIEAVFVFEAGPEHWSAPSSGQAISDCLRSRRAFDAEPHLHDLGLPRAWIRSSEGADAPRRLPNGQGVEQGRTGAPRVTNTRRE